MRLARKICGIYALFCSLMAGAVTCDTTLTLNKGWNAVYLPVAPTNTPSEVFASWPVMSVSVYNAQEYLSTSSIKGGLTTEDVALSPFQIWTREAPGSSTFKKFTADTVLVCCNTGTVAFSTTVRGEPAAPRIAWHTGDELNFVGIGIKEGDGVTVSASDYFEGSPSVSGNDFYKISGASEDSFKVTSMRGFGNSIATVRNGSVVLVAGTAISSWAGPLYISPKSGIDFGGTNTLDELSIRNDGVAAKSVSIKLVSSTDDTEPITVLVRNAAEEIINPEWKTLTTGGDTLTKTIGTNESWRLSFAFDRTKLTGTGKELGGILQIREDGGTLMSVNVPIKALDIKETTSWPSGLWAFDLELDKVSRYVTDTTRTDGVKAGGKMKLRLYVHVDKENTPRLLQRIIVGGTKKTDGTITSIGYAPDAKVPDGLDYERRLSSAALPVDLGVVKPTSGEWGTELAFNYKIAAKSPSNPFRHPLHPMFDGKDANFEELTYDGDDFSNYEKTVKPELFSLGGEIDLKWDAVTGTAWEPQESLTGTCDWIYTGLMRQGPVKASGTFTAQRVLPGLTLNLE